MSTPNDHKSNINDQKEIAFYGATVSAWTTTSMEFDKHIITVSSLGIGLIVSFLSAKGVRTALELIAHSAALLCFTISIICMLMVFSRNKSYLMSIVNNTTANTNDTVLPLLDKVGSYSVAAGVILTAMIGFSIGLESYTKAQKMVQKTRSVQEILELMQNGTLDYSDESLNGMQAMRPSNASVQSPQSPPANADQSNSSTAQPSCVESSDKE